MNKDEKIKELIDLLLKLSPALKKNVGKNRVAEALRSGIKLATNQQLCMNIIHEHSGISMSSVAAIMGVSNQQNTRIVTDLEEYGFVKRERDPNNKRTVLVDETEAGKKYYSDISKAMLDTAKKIFSELDDDVLDSLLYHFKEISKLIGQIG